MSSISSYLFSVSHGKTYTFFTDKVHLIGVKDIKSFILSQSNIFLTL